MLILQWMEIEELEVEAQARLLMRVATVEDEQNPPKATLQKTNGCLGCGLRLVGVQGRW